MFDGKKLEETPYSFTRARFAMRGTMPSGMQIGKSPTVSGAGQN